MSRLPLALLSALLWTGATVAQARELSSDDPLRLPLLNLARNTPVDGMSPEVRLTLSRITTDGSQAELCAVAMGADGEMVMRNGYMQMKRVQFRQQGEQWVVANAERIDMDPAEPFDKACHRTAGTRSARVLTAAIQEIQRHPPAAGTPSPHRVLDAATPPAAPTGRRCDGPATENLTELSGVGQIGMPGRSKLHSAPDPACYMGKFIVEHDTVHLLARVKGWMKVSYTHPLTKVKTVGWITSDRVTAMDAVQETPSQHAAATP